MCSVRACWMMQFKLQEFIHIDHVFGLQCENLYKPVVCIHWLNLQCTRPVSCWLEEMPEGLRALSLSSGMGPPLLHSMCKQVLASSTIQHPARNSLFPLVTCLNTDTPASALYLCTPILDIFSSLSPYIKAGGGNCFLNLCNGPPGHVCILVVLVRV